MAELLIHLQGHVAQTYTLILIRHFSSLETCQSVAWETADIWRHYHSFPQQMTSEKRALKSHTDDASLPRSE